MENYTEKSSKYISFFFWLALIAFELFAVSCLRLPVYAAATPSDAEYVQTATWSDATKNQILELLDGLNYDELDEQTQLELLSLYIQSLSGPGASGVDNATLANIETMLTDIHAELVPYALDNENDDLEVTVSDPEDVAVFDLSDDFNIDRNVIIYEGIWNGQSARLVLPASTATTLFIDSDSCLYNVGTDTITGRLFYDSEADLTDYNINAFTLTPCLGNNASTLYSSGYPSYNRNYYKSSSSYNNLSYDTTYGLFKVVRTVQTPSDLPADKNGIYLLFIALIGGAVLLCCLKK